MRIKVVKSETQEANNKLSLFEEINSGRTAQTCDICGKPFNGQHQLKAHSKNCQKRIYLERCVYQLEASISKQRTYLNKHIFKVKETEIRDKYSCNSSCKPFCRIFHDKHNWFKNVSEELTEKLHKIDVDNNYGCELRGKYFDSRSEKESHIQINIGAKGISTQKSVEKIFINTPEELVIKLCSNSSQDTEAVVDYPDSPNNLCNLCFLSFPNEDELKQHLTKHMDNVKPPSILKNN